VRFLVPDAAALVEVDPGRAAIRTASWAASFDGDLADDIAAVATGNVSQRLRALGGANAPAAAVVSWSGLRWVPLTALDALKLDGFDTLFVELVGTCNERCVHCYAESSPQVRAALERETCEAIVDDAHALGFRRIQFTGGDPLLCRFLPELVARARAMEQREIYTNGLLLDDELLDRLAPHAPSFAFSYYSHDPAVHDAITRTKGSHRRTRAAIERALARKLPVRVGIVVLSDNVDSVDATYADLEQMGVPDISVGAVKTAGRGSAFAWKPRDTTDASQATHRAASVTEGTLAVTYDGDVVPCIFNRTRKLGTVGPGRRLRDVIAELAVTGGPARGGDSLSCSSCQITDLALAMLAGER